MGEGVAGASTIAVLVAALALVRAPLGDHIARTLSSEKHLAVERPLHRRVGVDPDADQRWPVYARSVLAFSVASVLFLSALQRLQRVLPLSLGFEGVAAPTAWNTPVSFVTHTNWQSYSGESSLGHLVQASGLAVQDFVSAAVGIAVAVAVALVRGFARSRTDRIGNFWVDLVRTCLRVLLPLAGGCVGEGSARRVVVRVVERGVGIPDAATVAVFSAFQRGGDAPAGQGVGLGLAVARGLAQSFGATLEADDTPGGGLTMVFSLLPVRAPEAPSTPLVDGDRAAAP